MAKERTGVTHELDRAGNPGRYITDVTNGDSYLLFYLLFEDEVFEEWLENPALGAMIDYMLRGMGQLSSMVAFVRWHNPDITGKLTLNLHSDSPGSPEGVLPLGYDLVCNSALVLTPYTKENGGTGGGARLAPARPAAAAWRGRRPGRARGGGSRVAHPLARRHLARRFPAHQSRESA